MPAAPTPSPSNPSDNVLPSAHIDHETLQRYFQQTMRRAALRRASNEFEVMDMAPEAVAERIDSWEATAWRQVQAILQRAHEVAEIRIAQRLAAADREIAAILASVSDVARHLVNPAEIPRRNNDSFNTRHAEKSRRDLLVHRSSRTPCHLRNQYSATVLRRREEPSPRHS